MIIFNETHDDTTYATNLCYWMFDFKQDLNNCRLKKKKISAEKERKRKSERADNSPFSKENVRSSVFPSSMSHCLRNDALIQ